MSKYRRFVVGICAGLHVFAAALFALASVELPRAAERLGYEGQTVDVAVIPMDGYVGPEVLSARVLRFAADNNLSVAYIRASDSGIVTIEDPAGNFHHADGALARFEPGRHAQVLLARESDLREVDVHRALGDGVHVTGHFTSDLMYWGRYPLILANPEAVPFDFGTYTFAGEAPDVDAISSFFGQLGLELVNMRLNQQVPTSLAQSMTGLIHHPYGVIVLVFSLITTLGLLFVLRIHSVFARERYRVAAALGATQRQLQQIGLGVTLPVVGAGLFGGSVAAILVMLTTRELSMADDTGRSYAVLASVMVAGLVCVSLSWLVALIEAKGAIRAYAV
ncbi:hypothetical protein [Kribbella deserti]|uniref:FtsX-like permease family protein n=1 Tax=Kribbella deserti TaxID=1926257 RepID=A0ABV6QL88_9ACTN